MKKSSIVLCSLLLVGCTSSSVSSNSVKAGQEERFNYIYDSDDTFLKIFQDKKTKCKYIQLSNNQSGYGGLTPLLKSDGTPDCD